MTSISHVKDRIGIKRLVRVIDSEVHMMEQKREEIKKRDKYLCQACINGYEGVPFMFNYKDLHMHHIVSIDEDYSKRLDSPNLITLCPMHHKKAEQGIITKEELLKMIESQ